MPEKHGANGWGEWKKLVLHQLEQQNEDLKSLENGIILLRLELAKLKVKASIWGAVSGAIPAAVALIWYMLK